MAGSYRCLIALTFGHYVPQIVEHPPPHGLQSRLMRGGHKVDEIAPQFSKTVFLDFSPLREKNPVGI